MDARTQELLDELRLQAQQAVREEALEQAAQYHDNQAAECDRRMTASVSARQHRKDAAAIRDMKS